MKPGPELDTKLREWLLACRDRPLGSRDDRYIDLDERGVRGQQARRVILQDAIELAGDAPTCQLFTGYRGTGKSTDLARLQENLEYSGYIVLFADAEQFHTLSRNLAIEEMLPIIAGAFGAAAGELLGEKDVLDAGWWDRLSAFLSKDIGLDPALKLGPLQLKAAMRGDDAFLVALRPLMVGRLDTLAQQAHAFVQSTVARLRAKKPAAQGVVFLFDNLEKLSGPEHELQSRMDSVKRVFGDHHRYMRLPGCHTIYTVPLYLPTIFPQVLSRYDGEEMPVLPTVLVTERDDVRTPNAAGIAALEAVLGERIDLDTMFADRQQVERVVLASGGQLRGLFSLVNTLLLRARRQGLPLSEAALDAVMDEFNEVRREAIRADDVLFLDGIRTTRSLDHVTSGDMPRLARYLESSLVLCYRNGGGWFDLHPAVRDHVRTLAAMRLDA